MSRMGFIFNKLRLVNNTEAVHDFIFIVIHAYFVF